MRKHWLSAVVLVGLIATMVGAAADEKCLSASPAEAKTMALKAAAHLEKLGPRQAFGDFMDPDGRFFDRDLYVFVVDLDGNMWVNGAFPQAVGTNARAAEDAKGRRYIEQMLRAALARGEGWVEYQWINPCTGEYTDKATYFTRVGPFIVAVGAYGSVTA